MKVLLSILCSDNSILAECYKWQKECEKQNSDQHEKDLILKELDSAWKQKDYLLYVKLFQSAKSFILHDDNLYLKRFEYALKHYDDL